MTIITRIYLILIFVGATFDIFCPVFADRVSLLEETSAIHCLPKDKSAVFTELTISAKDTTVKFVEKGLELEFKTSRFLQSGLFAENIAKPGDFIWFQIFENGQTSLLRGSQHDFHERQCNDMHGVKSCKGSGGLALEWATDKLWTKVGKTETFADVSRYGLLGGRGTYFFGLAVSKPRRGIIIADYGEELQSIVGQYFELECAYVQ